jgi:hypothetical protein
MKPYHYERGFVEMLKWLVIFVHLHEKTIY